MQYLTVQEVAEILKLSKFTVYRKLEKGSLNGYEVQKSWKHDGTWRIPAHVVMPKTDSVLDTLKEKLIARNVDKAIVEEVWKELRLA